MEVEHVTGKEKYKCVMLNVMWKKCNIGFGSAECEIFKRLVFGILYLYL
jgi:hypothetical protein